MLPKYKDIVDLIKKGATVEAQEKIMELREAAVELQDEVHDLREKIKQVEEELRIKGQIRWKSPYNFLDAEDGEEGPYCQRCYDVERKLVRLLELHAKGFWTCHSCDKDVMDDRYQ